MLNEHSLNLLIKYFQVSKGFTGNFENEREITKCVTFVHRCHWTFLLL